MIKAFLLICGIAGYLLATQLGYDAATSGAFELQKLYTQALSPTAVISGAYR